MCWVDMSRQSELAEGDLLFSPFVAAGWSGKAGALSRAMSSSLYGGLRSTLIVLVKLTRVVEHLLSAEMNTRPPQWLGLLKLLAAWGAEWFYAGFFNVHFDSHVRTVKPREKRVSCELSPNARLNDERCYHCRVKCHLPLNGAGKE